MQNAKWNMNRMKTKFSRTIHAASSILDPRSYIHLLRLVHFYSYSHVRERRKITLGRGCGIAPNVSFRNAERITLGLDCQIGERCCLWAGESGGRIFLVTTFCLRPRFYYCVRLRFKPGTPIRQQTKKEGDIRIGSDVWLGARVVVTAGVTIGDGCVVGAGAVVTRDLPPGSISAGVPARVITRRESNPSHVLP